MVLAAGIDQEAELRGTGKDQVTTFSLLILMNQLVRVRNNIMRNMLRLKKILLQQTIIKLPQAEIMSLGVIYMGEGASKAIIGAEVVTVIEATFQTALAGAVKSTLGQSAILPRHP